MCVDSEVASATADMGSQIVSQSGSGMGYETESFMVTELILLHGKFFMSSREE